MKIFAIDPGNIQSAYCIMDDQYNLLEFAKLPNEECMKKLVSWIEETIPPREVVIERVASYGLAVGREVFETCEWIGRYTQEAEKKSHVRYIYRKDEKIIICGNMKAKDTNIRQALIDRFAKKDFKNGKGTKKDPDFFYGVTADCWAAIAIAVTRLDMRKENGDV